MRLNHVSVCVSGFLWSCGSGGNDRSGGEACKYSEALLHACYCWTLNECQIKDVLDVSQGARGHKGSRGEMVRCARHISALFSLLLDQKALYHHHHHHHHHLIMKYPLVLV